MIAKLCSNRGTDWHDITRPEILAAIDWQLLERLATDPDEAKASALNSHNYESFRQSYGQFVKEHESCDHLPSMDF